MLVFCYAYLNADSQCRVGASRACLQGHVRSLWATGSEPGAVDGCEQSLADRVELDCIDGMKENRWTGGGDIYFLRPTGIGFKDFDRSITRSLSFVYAVLLGVQTIDFIEDNEM